MASKQKPRILIALTSQRFLFTRTAASLIQAMMDAQRSYEVAFHFEMACDIVSARNRCVLKAQEANATHILFIDYDMYFPPDTIEKLLTWDKDIIGAAYNFRSDDLKSTAVPLTSPSQVHPDTLPNEPFKCECLGAGVLLINMSVFDKLSKPWFMFGYKEDGTMLYGEDTYFCQRAIKDAGLEVWADPTLHVKHIGEQLY